MIQEISVQELKAKLQANEKIQIIDIREAYELANISIAHVHIPLGELLSRENEIKPDGIVVIHCQSGQRAAAACESLKRLYERSNVYNLIGGLDAWIAETV